MYVCICNSVTDSAIRRAVADGVTSLAGLSRKTAAGTQCGTCIPMARQILDQALAEREAPPAPVELRVVCSR